MRTILVFLFLLLSGGLFAKEYQIIQTRGIVKLCNDGTMLKLGDKVSTTEAICLENKGDTIAAAALVDLDNGERFLLKAEKSEEEGKQKNKLVAMRVSANGGIRVEFQVNNIDDEIDLLRSQFGSGERIILTNKNSVKLKYAATNRISSFTAHYRYKGKWVKKYLPIKDRRLYFDRVLIFTVDGASVNPQQVSEVQIYYNDFKIYSKPVLIAKILPHFLSSREIMRELNLIISAPGNRVSATNQEIIIRRLYSYLLAFHGDISFMGNYEWLQNYVANNLGNTSKEASRKELMEKRKQEYLKAQKKKAKEKEKGGL